jgi:hypothetical protein
VTPSSRSAPTLAAGLAVGRRLEHALERLDDEGLQRGAAGRGLDLEASVKFFWDVVVERDDTHDIRRTR